MSGYLYRHLITALMIVGLLGLAGCRTEVVADSERDYVPSLRYFDLIDSYDQDTAQPPYGTLAINPYLYDGLFDVSWGVSNRGDYLVHLWINNRARIEDALLVQSQLCGPGLACDQTGGLICEYTSDFYLSCDQRRAPLDIAPLVTQIPEQLYLFLEVCDRQSRYCEYDYYPVLFE